MKRNAKSLIGYSIGVTDGEIGKVKEFYFDDKTWTIRYLVVKTGSWLFGRTVLISPEAFLSHDWVKEVLPVNLTMEQVKNSPDVDTEKPVSRQQEIKLYEHYPWTNYWGGNIHGAGIPVSMYQVLLQDEDQTAVTKSDDNPHLRSTANVTGYKIIASDGETGEVEDFIFDDKSWKLDFIVVETGNWFPGKKVLISPKLIKEINWETLSVTLKATIESIKNSPEYDPGLPVSETYATSLYNHYDGYFL